MDNQYIAVGLSSPLSKSSFILFILGVFHTPKSSIGLNLESGSLSVYLFYIPATSNLSRTELVVRRNLLNHKKWKKNEGIYSVDLFRSTGHLFWPEAPSGRKSMRKKRSSRVPSLARMWSNPSSRSTVQPFGAHRERRRERTPAGFHCGWKPNEKWTLEPP